MAQRERAAGREHPKKPRLTARDWADAALTAIREGGGLTSVAIEPLATRLATTKGSFYWHFANREALVEAALARWVETNTDEIIKAVESERDAEARLRKLLTEVTKPTGTDPLELSLLASTDHPQVAAALQQVTDRRIAYIATLFTDLGFPEPEAAQRALMAYSFYLGHAQLAHAVPSALPSREEFPGYLEGAVGALLGRG
ncbi:TetR/AcrR family transcriptional regulator [Streptomyces sp. CA-249302]|uniref:TetR/AcrR family transcriptional regulator n=1 Tax=Streptomyces sp. CA-249302 TaxID=3240058 RepID=UPI003D8C80A7